MTKVIAAFDSVRSSEVARGALLARGVSPDRISLQAADGSQAGDVAQHDEGFLSSVSDFFGRLFGDEGAQHSGRYSEAVRRGNAVLVVEAQTEQEADDLSEVLEANGAYDVDERASEWRASGWQDSSQSAAPTTATASASLADQGVVNVVQEDLKVGKREVDTGRVRVVRRVTEIPAEEQIRLREERAVVERRAVDRPATEAELAGLGEQTIELEEHREEAVVQKVARVVEEVVVGTQVDERVETVRENLRRSDVEVERVPSGVSATRELEDEDAVGDLSTRSSSGSSDLNQGRTPR